MVEDASVTPYENFGTSEEKYKSAFDELNQDFVTRLEHRQNKYDGGGCSADYHYPIDGAVTLYLTAYQGETPEVSDEVSTTTPQLTEGDVACIEIGESEFRFKLYGLYMERQEADHINNQIGLSYSLDYLGPYDGGWGTIVNFTGMSGAVTESYRGLTLRIAIADAAGYNAEDNFSNLVDNGLTPAEALDYWMVDVRHHPQNEWAEKRGKTQQAISKNVLSAREKLPELPEERPVSD